MKKIKQEKTIMRGGCLNCPSTEDILKLNTVLYNGFGGYCVKKNRKYYWSGDPQGKWKSFPTLRKFENLARKVRARWEVKLDNPMRGATWLRKGKNNWVLTETNNGFV